MKLRKKRILALVSMVSLCCTAMLLIDGVLQPGYWIKSACKVTLFLHHSYQGKGLYSPVSWGEGDWKNWKTNPVFLALAINTS